MFDLTNKLPPVPILYITDVLAPTLSINFF